MWWVLWEKKEKGARPTVQKCESMISQWVLIFFPARLTCAQTTRRYFRDIVSLFKLISSHMSSFKASLWHGALPSYLMESSPLFLCALLFHLQHLHAYLSLLQPSSNIFPMCLLWRVCPPSRRDICSSKWHFKKAFDFYHERLIIDIRPLKNVPFWTCSPSSLF